MSTATAIEICSMIKGKGLSIRKVPGTTIANSTSGRVIYTPPEGERVLREKLANWERYLHNETSVDPLIRMAVAHYQFEAIHPFLDGNGRTGRIVNILFLLQEELLQSPILYLSRYIIQNKDDYYQGLIEVTRHGAWESWILYMLKGIEETAKWVECIVNRVERLLFDTTEKVKEALPKVYSRELIDTIFANPYCRASSIVDVGLAKQQTALKYLKALCNIGVLHEKKIGRDKVFVNASLLAAIVEDV